MEKIMLAKNIIILALMLAISTLGASENEDSYIKSIKVYAEKNFNCLKLTHLQLQHLAWIQGNSYTTSELNVKVIKNPSNLSIEVLRTLTKLYCLQLLKSGKTADYIAFISAQSRNKNNNKNNNEEKNQTLSFQSFKKLSEIIKNLKPEAFEALKLSTILSSSYNEKHKKLAIEKLGAENVPSDSVEFLATVATQALDIFPLGKLLQTNHPNAIPFLNTACSHYMHFRHMMYAEGGIGMFKTLRDQVKLGIMSKEKLDAWYAHWIINIAGFRGHIAQNGSIYLTENVYQAMSKLRTLIDKMLIEPNFNPLAPYLNYRAQLLGLDTDPNALFLGKLGAMLRLYTKEDGIKLQRGLNKLSKEHQNKLLEQIKLMLTDYEVVTPTYSPSIFANALVYSNSLEKTICKIVPVYLKALEEYQKMLLNNQISYNIPLCFNELADKKYIQKFFEDDNYQFKIKINSDGLAQLSI